MFAKRAFIAFLFVMVLSAPIFGDDWKYFGAKKIKGAEGKLFYESESLEKTSEGYIRVWSKGITKSELERIMKKNEKLIVEKSEKNLANNYIPPFALVHTVAPPKLFKNSEDTISNILDIITWEKVANCPETKPSEMIFYEINCNDRKIRTLSVISYLNDGNVESNETPGAWIYNPLEPNDETLKKILCK
jgi:hypothetical protein